MRRLESWGYRRLWALLGVIALVALAGCLGIGEEEASSKAVSEQSVDDVEPTQATQKLWEMGHKDPYLDVEATGQVHEYDFWVDEKAVMNPYGDLKLGGFAFANSSDEPGQIPAPEIRVQQGDTVRVTLHDPQNNLKFPGHTMHWHGIDVPWRSDGVPFVTQNLTPAGEEGTYTYEFVARQAGTYWYHCVVEFPAHVDFGMFGPLIVEPKDGPELPYDREQTLMFHEVDSQYFATAFDWPLNPNSDPDPKRISENPADTVDSAKKQARAGSDIAGIVAGETTGQDAAYGSAAEPRSYYPVPSIRYRPNYDTFMINGKSYPDTQPVKIDEGETLRLRLINAGQLHKSIHLHGHHVLVTHNDGYPLDDPYWADTVNLEPGGRKDVYVQGTNPGIWKLHDHSGSSAMGSTNANDYAFPGGMITALVYEDFQPPEGLPAGDETGQATAGDYAVHAHSEGGR